MILHGIYDCGKIEIIEKDLPQIKAEIEIIIKENKESKLNEIRESINDKLFLNDLKQVSQDFEAIDSESW